MKRLLALLVLALVVDAAAQGMPRRDRAGSPRERPSANATPAPIVPSDPYSALERELPSLQLDLMLKPDQMESWRIFSRDVRDAAEMDRARRKHLMALREQSATSVIATLAEEDRLKSEATAELKRHFDQLYLVLDDAQRRTLDRRVVQSQSEPLGR